MRLIIDKVTHPIHCYYPKSGKKYFDRLRFSTIYHDTLSVIEHPVSTSGLVEQNECFQIEADFLDHSVETIGWRITERDRRKFSKEKLEHYGIRGRQVRTLQEKGSLQIEGKSVFLDDVSWIQPGDILCVVSDTRACPAAVDLARNAKLFLCEATYLEEHQHLAHRHSHSTAKQAAEMAAQANAELLVLTHFSARYIDTKPFKEEARTIFPNTVVAKDGKIIPFPK